MATRPGKKTGGAKRKRMGTVKDLALPRRRGDAAGAVKGGALRRPKRAECDPAT